MHKHVEPTRLELIAEIDALHERLEEAERLLRRAACCIEVRKGDTGKEIDAYFRQKAGG